ncbi:MAG: phosphate propanoyltransferase [Elusimicrobiota bacterium]|nr:phosphate propanoyltransferase [Elusimicrobiota bacterium]
MNKEKLIPGGIAVRHMHISSADLEILFGKGYKLTKLRDLTQTGEYASNETVTLVGPKLKALQGVRILGPERKNTQIELSLTDAIYLGVNPPVRASGDISGSAGITVVGPKGSINLTEGVIIAKRHIHMSPEDAKNFNLKDGDTVDVEYIGERGVIFRNVQIRVKDNFVLEFHIDTDEGNCAGIKQQDKVRIINLLSFSGR